MAVAKTAVMCYLFYSRLQTAPVRASESFFDFDTFAFVMRFANGI